MDKIVMDKISDELREWCESENGTGCGGFVTKKISDELREFADAEVLSAIEISDLKHMAKRIDAEMVELPKDADEVPIHVGDKVTEHEDGHTFKVDGFMDWDGEWWVFMRDGIQAPASRCTHYHEPTVEDVLRAMLDALDVDVCADPDATIAEYAKRLRLVEEDE